MDPSCRHAGPRFESLVHTVRACDEGCMTRIDVRAGGEDRADGATGRDVLAGVWNVADSSVAEPGGRVAAGEVVAREHDRFADRAGRAACLREVERWQLARRAGGRGRGEYRTRVTFL